MKTTIIKISNEENLTDFQESIIKNALSSGARLSFTRPENLNDNETIIVVEEV